MQGACPHCNKPSTFLAVTGVYVEHPNPSSAPVRLWAVLQCQGCFDFICGGISKPQLNAAGPGVATYHAHYPIGKPDDNVAGEIPAEIAADFSEALRCRWVNAYNATAEMCRRAIQTSCDDLKAVGNNLFEQIDDLAKRGIITGPLQKMAHKVRLGGNRGAHPSGDKLTDKDADAVITFSRHYFEHVYVMPAALASVDFSKAAAAAPAQPVAPSATN